MTFCHEHFHLGVLPLSRRHSRDKSNVACTPLRVRYGRQTCTTLELRLGKQFAPAPSPGSNWPSGLCSAVGVGSGRFSYSGWDLKHIYIQFTHSGSSHCAASTSKSGIHIPSELRRSPATPMNCRPTGVESEENPFPCVPLVETITSPSNAFIKHCVKLRTSSSYRRAAKTLLVVGSTPLREILSALSTSPLHLLFTREGSIPPALSGNPSPRTIQVSSAVMARLVGMGSAEGVDVVGLMSLPDGFVDLGMGMGRGGWGDGGAPWSKGAKRVLALDGIQDPGNLGTLLRTAAAFAWDGVFLLPGCCDPFNDKALRASRGCVFRLPLIVGEWDDLMTWTKSNRVSMFAADPGDDSGIDCSTRKESVDGLIKSVKSSSTLEVACMKDKICLVLGSEGQGLSELALRECTKISIPMPGGVESLNVAIAGGILLYLLKSQALTKF